MIAYESFLYNMKNILRKILSLLKPRAWRVWICKGVTYLKVNQQIKIYYRILCFARNVGFLLKVIYSRQYKWLFKLKKLWNYDQCQRRIWPEMGCLKWNMRSHWWGSQALLLQSWPLCFPIRKKYAYEFPRWILDSNLLLRDAWKQKNKCTLEPM